MKYNPNKICIQFFSSERKNLKTLYIKYLFNNHITYAVLYNNDIKTTLVQNKEEAKEAYVESTSILLHEETFYISDIFEDIRYQVSTLNIKDTGKEILKNIFKHYEPEYFL